MIFGQDRGELRRAYADAWRKYCDSEVLTPLENQIAAVVAEHPEYHEVLEQGVLDREWHPDGGQSNPFLHMGLHLAIREQVATDRPNGIRAIHERLCTEAGDAHTAEHRMIEVLAECLWESQSRNEPPDDRQYLEQLERL